MEKTNRADLSLYLIKSTFDTIFTQSIFYISNFSNSISKESMLFINEAGDLKKSVSGPN